MKKRACLLKRVSTKAESQDSSYINQEKQLIEIIKKNDEVIFDESKDVFEDRYTGTKIKRKNINNNGFDKLMELLGIDIVDTSTKDYIELSVKSDRTVKPYYDLIYCKSTSRFHRASYKGQSVLYLLKELGIDVYYLDLNKYLSELSDMEISLYSLIDSTYSKTVSFNYRNNNILKTNNRELMSRTEKFGYDRIKKNNHIYLVKNEEEFKIFEMIKDLFVNQNLGSEKISYILNEKGIKNKFSKNGKWSRSTVHNILTDRHYSGETESSKYGQEKYHIYPEEYVNKFGVDRSYIDSLPYEWKECTYIEQLEPKSDYDLRMKIFEQRTENAKSKKGVRISYQKPSRYCVCGICKKHYYSKGKNKNYREDERVFICSSKRFTKEQREIDCMNYAFYENFFNEQLEKKSIHLSADLKRIYKENIESLERLIVHLVLSLDRDFKDTKDDLETEMSELETQREKILDLYLSSLSTKDFTENRLNEIGLKYDNLKKKLEVYNNQKKEIKKSIDLINEKLRELKDRYCKIKENYSSDEVLDHIEKILVFPKRSKYIKANQVIFIYQTKAEFETFEIIDDVFKSDFINLLPPKTFKLVDISKSRPNYYLVRPTKPEQRERAEELLKSL